MKNCTIHSEKISKADDFSDYDVSERIISIVLDGERKFFAHYSCEDVTGAHDCVVSESLTPFTDNVGQRLIRDESIDDDIVNLLTLNPGKIIHRQYAYDDDRAWKVKVK